MQQGQPDKPRMVAKAYCCYHCYTRREFKEADKRVRRNHDKRIIRQQYKEYLDERPANDT